MTSYFSFENRFLMVNVSNLSREPNVDCKRALSDGSSTDFALIGRRNATPR